MLGPERRHARAHPPTIDELRASPTPTPPPPGQIVLAWLIQFYGDIVVAIPGASKPHQTQESAAALDLRLTDKELTRLGQLSRDTRH